jgi:hypothetical protein
VGQYGSHPSSGFDQHAGGDGVRSDFYGGQNRNVVGQTNTHPNRPRPGLGTQPGSGARGGEIKSGLAPNKRVEWECISTHRKSSPASAWTGTHFIFEMVERDNGAKPNQVHATSLDFYQTGYDERSEFFGSNDSAWAEVLQNLTQVVGSQRS